MHAVEPDRSTPKNRFAAVAEPFLRQPGLPFAEVLTAEALERAFAENDTLFGQRDIFSTPIVPWAFLAQVLRGGKGAACAAAVADIATYVRQTGGRGPSGDTGDYCRARSKPSLPALRGLTTQAAQPLEEGADPSRPRHGPHAKPIDGSTFTMPDTRDIKQILGLDHVRCKTPERVRRELWATLSAYDLVRKPIAAATAVHGKQPRTVGFTLARQTVLSSWMLPATEPARDARGPWRSTPARIAANEAANRPGRIEPRALKRRRHRYPLMRRPRQQLRRELGKT